MICNFCYSLKTAKGAARVVPGPQHYRHVERTGLTSGGPVLFRRGAGHVAEPQAMAAGAEP